MLNFILIWIMVSGPFSTGVEALGSYHKLDDCMQRLRDLNALTASERPAPYFACYDIKNKKQYNSLDF